LILIKLKGRPATSDRPSHNSLNGKVLLLFFLLFGRAVSIFTSPRPAATVICAARFFVTVNVCFEAHLLATLGAIALLRGFGFICGVSLI
jgi:hypothetical protein